jgi:hypothetical protein
MQQLPDAATQQRPVLRPDGEAPAEIEQGDLVDFAADPLAAQQPIGAAALAILLPETDPPSARQGGKPVVASAVQSPERCVGLASFGGHCGGDGSANAALTAGT